MWDPFRPLHEREQLLVSCLADVSHWVVWLQRRGEMHGEGGDTFLVRGFYSPLYTVTPCRNPPLQSTACFSHGSQKPLPIPHIRDKTF